MKKNVIMIANPVSGDLDKTEFIDAAAILAAEKNLNFILYQTCGEEDSSKIRDLYEIYKPERVIIAGGDGTIKMVSETLEDEDVILGILPAGSANGLAGELNLMPTLEENLKIAFGSKYIKMDLIAINGKKSMHLSDIGLNAELVKNYEKSAVHGKWGYALQAFNTLVELDKGPKLLNTISSELCLFSSFSSRAISFSNSVASGLLASELLGGNSISNLKSRCFSLPVMAVFTCTSPT